MSDELKPEDRALIEAAEDLLTAYRERYAKRSTDGVRTNAPLRREMGTLKIALDAARAQGPSEAVEQYRALTSELFGHMQRKAHGWSIVSVLPVDKIVEQLLALSDAATPPRELGDG